MTTAIQVRIDLETKKKAKKVFADLGMSFSTGVVIYLRQVAKSGTLPIRFTDSITPEIPNKRTQRILKESQKEYNDGLGISFDNAKDSLAFLDTII